MDQAIPCQSQHGAIVLHADSIPFSDFPDQSKLFVDYQRDPLALKKYYPSAVACVRDVGERIPEVLSSHRADRGVLCDALTEINVKFDAGPKTLENIELLRSPDTVAVVTGQQAGLFSGPLYTIYKALSAVREAECLNAKGIQAVPVFWVATEDHDFDEVSKTYVLDSRGALVESATEPKHCHENLPVGYVTLDESIKEDLAQLVGSLMPTEFTVEVRDLLETTWKPGEYFGDAFGKLLMRLLVDYGLIILCPLNPKLKQLASPIYVKAIERSAEIVEALRKRSDELVADGLRQAVHEECDGQEEPDGVVEDRLHRAASAGGLPTDPSVRGRSTDYRLPVRLLPSEA